MEHVRYRSSTDHVGDLEVQATMQAMRMEARDALTVGPDNLSNLQSLWDTPGSASVSPAEFVKQAHFRSLQVTTLKEPDQAARLEEYAKLLERFPDSTVNKVGGAQLNTLEGRAKAVVQLTTKHSGDMVDIDRTLGSWILRPVVPYSASTVAGEQWLRCEEGLEAKEKDSEFGWHGMDHIALQMDIERWRPHALAHEGGACCCIRTSRHLGLARRSRA